MYYIYFNDTTIYNFKSLEDIYKIKNPKNVMTLNFTWSKITCLDGKYKNLFAEFTNLLELNLRDNIITNLDKNIFKNNTQLQLLQLSNNAINDMDKDIFKYNIQLQHLDLGYNKLTNLDKDIFNNLTQLEHLDLGYNKLTNLDKDIFKYNIALRSFSIDTNKIQNLDKDIFINLTNLKCLILINNNLYNLDKDIFANLTQLQQLCLSDNKLTNIPNSILQCINLTYCNYDNNEIEYIPPNIQNFLNRLRQHSEKLQVYNDNQNVHNHQIQECIKTSLENILNIPKVINKEQLINDVITSEVMNKTSIQLLLEYCNDNSIHSILNITFEQALLHILEYINLECSEYKEEIYKILADEILDGRCKCFTGRISRLINCLNGFTPLIEVKIPENIELSNIIVMIKQSFKGDSIDELHTLVRKELLERGYENELINEYVEYIEL
jgi:hypothetical protein